MKPILMIAAALLAAACARTTSEPAVAARPMTEQEIAAQAVRPGDCVEARRRAAADPEIEVDKLPAITAQKPRPYERIPASVQPLIARDGASVKIDVLIDTLGRPVMSTFKVVESTPHEWMARHVRALMPRWKFSPAELAGCKVPRVYKFSATTPKKS